jgi:general secretion pathway protein D
VASTVPVSAETVTYIDVGLKLDVEPTIYANDEVAIRIGLEVTNIIDKQVSKNETQAYTIGNRSAQTVLRLKDGENQVLAGLINDEDRRTLSKLPGLGDLPLLGRLFGSQLDDKLKSEIVLSITPRLVRPTAVRAAELKEFDSGNENSLRRPPVSVSFSAQKNEVNKVDAQKSEAQKGEQQ